MFHPIYRRVLLKLSGEAIGARDGIFDYDFLQSVVAALGRCREAGVQVAVVIGGGNIWRGAREGDGMDRPTADTMGMLATTINALALRDACRREGLPARVLCALEMPAVAELFTKDRALAALCTGEILFLAGGSGRPFFSTDTAAVLRGAELEADLLLFAKNVDGVYTADPRTDPTARRLDEVTFDEILRGKLGVIDLAAAALCESTHQKLLIFGLDDPENILRALSGEKIGTLVHA